MDRRVVSVLLSLALVVGLCPSTALANSLTVASSGQAALSAQTTYAHTFTLSASSIAVDGETTADGSEKITGTDYEISKKLKLTITAGGTYRIEGTRADVAKGIEVNTEDAVTLVLGNLSLSTTDDAPLVCKGKSNVTIDVEGTATLTDSETDASNGNDPEGAAIKAKSGTALTITGTGSLTANGAYKNGIKGGAGAAIAIGASTDDSVKVTVTAANNGLAADGQVIVNGGTLDVTAKGDGIKSSPDPDDTISDGIIIVNGGTTTVKAGDEGIVAEPGSATTDGVTTTNTTAKSTIDVNGGSLDITTEAGDGIRAEGDIAITNGTFEIASAHDGIQTNSNLNIANGSFNVKAGGGYSSSAGRYTGDDSCKGLKANYSINDGNASSKDTSSASNALNITGGTFTLNTRDDAVHSDAYCTITGGTLEIETNDDGVHADTALTLGTEGGYARDPEITVKHSYEGLEAGSVFAYSGKCYVVASDDGINAAGGSSNGSDPFKGGGTPGGPNDGFNPGGQPNQGGPNGRGGRLFGTASSGSTPQAAASGSYQIDIEGGTFYVNCTGDGLDSNGALTLGGGMISVFSQSAGDNSAIDADGTVSINGATLFTAGAQGMNGDVSRWFGNGQGYTTLTQNMSANQVVNVTSGTTTLYSDTLPRAASYLMYSAPKTPSSSLSIKKASSVDKANTNAWNHTWTSSVTKTATTQESGIETYRCADISAIEQKTIPAQTAATATTPTGKTETQASDSDSSSNETDAGYAVAFSGENYTVNVYYAQDYTTANEVGVTSAVSRNSTTGKPDGTGDGQVNFTIVPANGYELDGTPTITGTYKNLKDISSDSGIANTYRITKIEGALTVTVSVKKTVANDNEQANAGTNSNAPTNNTVTVKKTSVTKTYKASAKTKKLAKAKKFSLPAATTLSGTAKYKVTDGSAKAKKYLKVVSGNKIKVAKNTPRGTYWVKVKAYVDASSSYTKAVSKAVKVKVKVK